MLCEWDDKIFKVNNQGFNELALDVFRYQYKENEVYRNYVQALNTDVGQVTSVDKIPFLPVEFFKTHQVKTTEFDPQVIFESSGTSQTINSQHLVKEMDIYVQSFTRAFELFYGSAKDYCVIGLLPAYLERSGSSLIYMVDHLIKASSHPQSGFYLDEFENLYQVLKDLKKNNQKLILIGVTFGLLDFAASYNIDLSGSIVMETGGMKGRRKEMIREDVHAVLQKAFNLDRIHSEYGMTELLSQAYSFGDGIFRCPPWMKLLIRDEEDPLSIKTQVEASGAINIIDLANIYSCSFIATKDVGKLFADESFEVRGRMDGSDLRGCSLMLV
jgi:phenylacetate-coenzyme A ligase PaaK-like adenylate-forming protein